MIDLNHTGSDSTKMKNKYTKPTLEEFNMYVKSTIFSASFVNDLNTNEQIKDPNEVLTKSIDNFEDQEEQ
jgi:hypothetical protein